MAGLLEGKVVVISGVGPALGTTLARRCAEQGADLVLAARTVERLEDVAKQITDLGRRAVSVGTDITDEAQVDNLVEETLKAYGKVDVLINNAFRVPSMRPLADTTFEHMRDAIELTVFGALRHDPGLHAGAGRGQGLGGQRQLDGGAPLAGQVRRVQDGEVGAAGDVAVAGHRTGRAGHPRQFGSARLYLGRHAAGLLRTPGRQVRHHASTRSTRRPPSTAISSGCPPRTRWPRRSCSWRATCPAASPARRSTSTAGSTRRDERSATDVGTVDDLHASAVKACGLDDFGVDDDNYREALGVLLESLRARRRPHRVRQQDAAVLRPQRAGGPAGVRGGVQAVPAARRRADRAADLRDRPAAHRDHRHPPAAHRRPARIRASSCGWRSSRSRVRRAKPGRRTRFSSRSTRSSPRRTRRTRTTPACTT